MDGLFCAIRKTLVLMHPVASCGLAPWCHSLSPTGADLPERRSVLVVAFSRTTGV
jgi:hypothetical protein